VFGVGDGGVDGAGVGCGDVGGLVVGGGGVGVGVVEGGGVGFVGGGGGVGIVGGTVGGGGGGGGGGGMAPPWERASPQKIKHMASVMRGIRIFMGPPSLTDASQDPCRNDGN
jgi:hypothetical protein